MEMSSNPTCAGARRAGAERAGARSSLARSLLLLALALLWALPAAARPGYPDELDRVCRGTGRQPNNPAALARANDGPLGDCALCHDFDRATSVPDATNVTQDGRDGAARILDAFCRLAGQNVPPRLDFIPDAMVDEGSFLIVPVRARDLDGHAVTLQAANLPRGATFSDDGQGIGSLSWVPDYDQAGNYRVSFLATDDGSPPATTGRDVVISVGAVNRPPSLDPIGDQQVQAGQALRIDLSASDPDGDPLTVDAIPMPVGASINPGASAGTWTFDWTPDRAQVGNFGVDFVASDGLLDDNEIITITVGAVNAPPTLMPIGDRSGEVGDTIEVPMQASDPDQDEMAFSVEGAPPEAVFLDRGDGTAKLMWTSTQAEFHSVTVTVTDDGTPPMHTSETLMLTARPRGGDGVLDPIKATWHARKGKLVVRVRGANPDATVELFTSTGGDEPVASDTANARGRVRFVQRLETSPCTVEVVSDGATSGPIEVRNRPAACDGGGEASPAEITRVRFGCNHGGVLRVRGHGVDPGLRVLLADPNGQAMDEGWVNKKGRFRFVTRMSHAPEHVVVIVGEGDGSWHSDPLPVDRRDRACTPPRSDDDDDRGDDDGDDDGGHDDDGDDDEDDGQGDEDGNEDDGHGDDGTGDEPKGDDGNDTDDRDDDDRDENEDEHQHDADCPPHHHSVWYWALRLLGWI